MGRRSRPTREAAVAKATADEHLSESLVAEEHSKDDDELVTKKWLVSIGATSDEGLKNGDIYICAWVRVSDGGAEFMVGEKSNQVFLPDGMVPKTRGEFRRLCAALKVPITEGGAT